MKNTYTIVWKSVCLWAAAIFAAGMCVDLLHVLLTDQYAAYKAGFVSTHCLEIGIACRVDVVDSHWFGDRNRVFFCTEGHYFVD